MATKDLRDLSPADLQTKLAELRKELVEKLRSARAGELQNVSSIKKVRRTIATVLTLVNQKQPAAKEEE